MQCVTHCRLLRQPVAALTSTTTSNWSATGQASAHKAHSDVAPKCDLPEASDVTAGMMALVRMRRRGG